MLDALKRMVASKKAVAMAAGVVVGLVAKVGIELPTDAVAAILAPIVAYILGQGLADQGKEARG